MQCYFKLAVVSLFNNDTQKKINIMKKCLDYSGKVWKICVWAVVFREFILSSCIEKAKINMPDKFILPPLPGILYVKFPYSTKPFKMLWYYVVLKIFIMNKGWQEIIWFIELNFTHDLCNPHRLCLGGI